MKYDLDNLIEHVAGVFANQSDDMIYLENFRHYFVWNKELDAWVVLNRDLLDDRLMGVLDALYQDAIESGEPTVLKLSLDLREQVNKNKIIRSFREKITQPLRVLNEKWA